MERRIRWSVSNQLQSQDQDRIAKKIIIREPILLVVSQSSQTGTLPILFTISLGAELYWTRYATSNIAGTVYGLRMRVGPFMWYNRNFANLTLFSSPGPANRRITCIIGVKPASSPLPTSFPFLRRPPIRTPRQTNKESSSSCR
jgi:hypothetical protein